MLQPGFVRLAPRKCMQLSNNCAHVRCMHAVAKFSCVVHMPFGREPMTCRVVWEPSHGWSVVSDLIYFVDLRSASLQRRRRVSLICIRHCRRCRGVADWSSQLALGVAERSFYAVIAMLGEASPKIDGRRRAATATSRPPSSPATAEAANL